MLPTMLTHNGRPVRLEIVIFKPRGKGPFPLVVFNHGSTGNGRNPKKFKRTYWNKQIARYFSSKGWLVAFPQRRGRGRSDGRYDEGFASVRSWGYACSEEDRSVAGAKRALIDIHAAVEALLKRRDIRKGRFLIAGQSRGGALSVAYAGRHPKLVAGAINFVGGWMSGRCINGSRINWNVFNIGVSYPSASLWCMQPRIAFTHLHTASSISTVLGRAAERESS